MATLKQTEGRRVQARIRNERFRGRGDIDASTVWIPRDSCLFSFDSKASFCSRWIQPNPTESCDWLELRYGTARRLNRKCRKKKRRIPKKRLPYMERAARGNPLARLLSPFLSIHRTTISSIPSRCIRHPATSSPFDIVSALSSSRCSQTIPGPSSTRLLMVTAQPADDGKKKGGLVVVPLVFGSLFSRHGGAAWSLEGRSKLLSRRDVENMLESARFRILDFFLALLVMHSIYAFKNADRPSLSQTYSIVTAL